MSSNPCNKTHPSEARLHLARGVRARAWTLAAFGWLAVATSGASAASLTVYDGALENGFANNDSWAASYSFANTSVVNGSEHASISFKPDSWGGIRVLASGGNTRFSMADYGSVTFLINGGTGSAQKINLNLEYIQFPDTDHTQTADYGAIDVNANTSGGITAHAWKQVTINFDALGLTYGAVNALQFQAATGNAQAQVYITDIVFNARTSPIASGAAVNVSVDTSVVGNAVSPLIFGVAYGDGARNGQIGYTVRRWGGNSTTRYNWQVDVNSTASDWYFENTPNSTDRTAVPPLNNTADKFVTEANSAGSRPLITIPTIGWTPRADSKLNHPYTVGFSVAKYGAQASTDSQWDPNAGNGIQTDGTTPITGNDPTDSSTMVDQTFEQEWIAHLQSTFGKAASGGVRYFTLDNEVMLWNSTHRDVHPIPPDEDEIWGKALTYGKAIKQQEPNARVTGPVTWGYCDLFWSAKDNCGKSNTDRNRTSPSGPDHDGLPFVAWYLRQNCANGKPVDYLDLHYYPQGGGISLSGDDSPATAALRLASLRELYDSTWISQSWISDLGNSDGNHYSIPNLIPRARGWINLYCPTTKLAITEYNWGNDDTATGAVAQAEALAIFAREGLDMATRWVAPYPTTVAENAFSIFLNYDNNGSKVAGNSVSALSSNVDEVGAYAFDIPGQRTMILLTNKDFASHDALISFPSARAGTWQQYAFTGASNLSAVGGVNTISGSTLTVSALPPMSATLVAVSDPAVAYVPLAPARLLDTRPGAPTADDSGAGAGAVGPNGSIAVDALGRGGVPATGVGAVVLNVTVTGPTGNGFVTVWPTGSPQPATTNLNFTAGQTIANVVIVKPGTNGKVSVYNSTGATQVVADVVGYFTNTSALTPLAPARLLDTRAGGTTIDGQFAAGGAIAAGASLDLTIAARDGLPAAGGVGAVVLNVTATSPTGTGFVTVWPSGNARPASSNINFVPGQTVSNLVVSQVSSAGKVSLFNSNGSTQIVADIVGWFPASSELTSLVPARLLDTRAGRTTTDGLFAGGGSLGAKASLDLSVLGRGNVPASGVGAVLLNVTATGPSAAGYITAWPTGATRPTASNLNFVAGQTIPNLVVAKIGSGGKISLFNSAGSTDLIVDVFGWLPPLP